MRTRPGRFRLLALLLLPLVAASCGDRGVDLDGITPEELLEHSASRMESVESFAFRLEHENGFTSVVRGLAMETAEGQLAGRDRLSAELRARAGPIAVNVGLIVHPEGAWITNPLTGQWEPEALTIEQLFDPATGVTALMRDLADVRVIGTETLGGVATRQLEGTVDSGALATLLPGVAGGHPLTVRVWVGAEDPLVHRIDVLGAIEPADTPQTVRRLRLSRFDEPFQIEPPR